MGKFIILPLVHVKFHHPRERLVISAAEETNNWSNSQQKRCSNKLKLSTWLRDRYTLSKLCTWGFHPISSGQRKVASLKARCSTANLEAPLLTPKWSWSKSSNNLYSLLRTSMKRTNMMQGTHLQKFCSQGFLFLLSTIKILWRKWQMRTELCFSN